MTLFDFDIIGFASIIEVPSLPRVLAPVFRDRTQADFVLLPPFVVVGDEVFTGIVTNTAEFEALVSQEKLTVLDSPIQAKTNHDLWVNPEGCVTYVPKIEVKRAFKALFTKHLALAEEELAAASFEKACQHAGIARAVNPGNLDPLVIRATAERFLGAATRFAFTRHIAEDIVAPAEFDKLIQARTGDMAVAALREAAVMRHIVTIKSSRFATAA